MVTYHAGLDVGHVPFLVGAFLVGAFFGFVAATFLVGATSSCGVSSPFLGFRGRLSNIPTLGYAPSAASSIVSARTPRSSNRFTA